MTKRKDKKAPIKISAAEREEKVNLSANEELETEVTPQEEIIVEEAEVDTHADEIVIEEAKQEEAKEEQKKVSKQKEQKNLKKEKGKDDKKKSKADKKERKGLKRRTKETVSELKKVTWPTFPEVVKKTGVVIAVVLIFAVVLLCLDLLFGFLSSLLMRKPFVPFS